jgi:hypothetical protein
MLRGRNQRLGQAPHQGIMTGTRNSRAGTCPSRNAGGSGSPCSRQDSTIFRARLCAISMVSERLRPSATSPGTSGLVPKYRPLLETRLGRGWPLLQHSPDALVVSLGSPECVTIISNLAPPHEMSSMRDTPRAKNRTESASETGKIEDQKTRTLEHHKGAPPEVQDRSKAGAPAAAAAIGLALPLRLQNLEPKEEGRHSV